MRQWIIDKVPKAFLLRVPLLLWTVMLASPLAAVNAVAKGLFFLQDWRTMTAVSAAAFLASAACLVNFNLILMAGEFRFKLSDPNGHPRRRFLFAWLGPLLVTGTAVYVTGFRWSLIGGIAFGLAIAVTVIILSELVRAALMESVEGERQPVCMIWPGKGAFLMRRWVRGPAQAEAPVPIRAKRAALSLWAWPKKLLMPFLQQGYFEPHLRSAHGYAFSIAMGSWLFYLLVAATHRAALVDGDPTRRWGTLPALGWVLMLMALASWTLSAATFFLDKFRVPLILGVVLVSALTATKIVPQGDHYYRSDAAASGADRAAWDRPSSAQVIHDRNSSKIVVISAPGGGIQSTAWTTYVLREIDQATGGDFLAKVAAISSVSGGSVGIFHLAAQGFKPSAAYETAKLSSIDHVAWGWFVPDLGRAILPWVGDRTVDRGWALEQSLEANARVAHLYMDDPSLRPGPRTPALIVNSTILENGHPLVFSTSRLTEDPGGAFPPCGPRVPPAESRARVFGADDTSTSPYDYWDLYHRRIRLVTAARLSATFPYVSPAARTFPETPGCGDYHLLDGGYYDNYGIFALSKWVLTGLEHTPLPAGAEKWEILLVRIFAFPGEAEAPKVDGWGNQVVAPVSGVLHARSESQLVVGRYIRDLVENIPRVEVTTAEFHYDWTVVDPTRVPGSNISPADCKDPPLNWVLTKEQVACIEAQPLSSMALTAMKEFLAPVTQGGR